MIGLFKSPPALKTPQAVRDAIQTRLSDTGRISAVHAKGDDGLEVIVDGKAHSFFLENAVVAILQDGVSPRGQHKSVKHYVSAFLSSLEDTGIDLDKVYPIVRHRDYMQVDDVAAIHTAMFGDLVCTPALDRPDTLATLTKDAIDDAELAVAEVWGAARVNLSVALKSIEDEDLGAGLHIMRLSEPWLGMSILLAPELLHVARRELGAETLYVAAPSREGVVYIDCAAAGAFARIQEAVEIGLSQDHPQSAYIFTLGAEDQAPQPGWRCEDGLFLTAT